MLYFFCFYHILLFIEGVLLYKERLRKKGIILLFTNSLLTILNITKIYSFIKVEDSLISYIKEELINHSMSNIIWILLNIFLIIFTIYLIKYASKKERQAKGLKVLIYSVLYILSIFFLNLLFSKSITFFLLLILLVTFYKLIEKFKKEKENYVFVILLLLTIFTWYSFFTDTGAARLQIALNGYIKGAYETGLEELKYHEEKNLKKFSPIKTFSLLEEEITLIEVKSYGWIKIGNIKKN